MALVVGKIVFSKTQEEIRAEALKKLLETIKKKAGAK